MGQVAVAPTDDMQAIIELAGGDRDRAEYDADNGLLIVEGVTDNTLINAKQALQSGSRNATPKQKQEKRRHIRRKAERAAMQALLDADTVYQQKLTDIQNATTVADLRAIDYP